MNDFFLTMEAIKNGQTWDICRTGEVGCLINQVGYYY